VNDTVVRLTFVIGKGCFSGNNFAVRRDPFWQVEGFNTAWPCAEDADLALRLGKVTKVAFRPEVVMRISSRRAREGYWKVIRRAAANYIKILWLGRPPTNSFDDIR
jgi:hypothetical protein